MTECSRHQVWSPNKLFLLRKSIYQINAKNSVWKMWKIGDPVGLWLKVGKPVQSSQPKMPLWDLWKSPHFRDCFVNFIFSIRPEWSGFRKKPFRRGKDRISDFWKNQKQKYFFMSLVSISGPSCRSNVFDLRVFLSAVYSHSAWLAILYTFYSETILTHASPWPHFKIVSVPVDRPVINRSLSDLI